MNLNSLTLWTHQKEALKVIKSYVAGPSSNSALIKIPTGAGKTGIIATCCQLMDEIGDALIVCPSEFLTKQISHEVASRFFETISFPSAKPLKAVFQFLPSTLESILDELVTTSRIFVCTNQTLQIVFSEKASLYRKLKSTLDVVFVDEGHREPASKWARSIRDLNKKTVLMSATPYRNDFKQFNIDKDHVYQYSYIDAVSDRFLRRVEFHEHSDGLTPEYYVSKLLKFVKKLAADRLLVPGLNDRVIVRCADSKQIEAVTKFLIRAGEKAIGIHENFSGSQESALYVNVPNPHSTDAQYWVHQHKLTEGIDDSRFAVLAVYEPDRNARALVQQIGRISRNPGRKTNQVARVFASAQFRLKDQWDAFQRYETALSKDLLVASPERIIDDLLILQDEYSYLDGTFRNRFDPNDNSFYDHLRIRPAVNIYSRGANFRIRQIKEVVNDHLTENGLIFLNEAIINSNTAYVCLFADVDNSPIIDQAFLQTTLEYIVVVVQDDYVFFSSSSKSIPDLLECDLKRLDPLRLERLLSSSEAVVSKVSLLNSNLSSRSIRRQSLSAPSIGLVAPGVADHAQFCSTLQGSKGTGKKDRVSRYIGFTRARVADSNERELSFQKFLDWTRRVSDEIESNASGTIRLLDRYANYVPFSKDPNPVNILLDLHDVTFKDSRNFKDTCLDVNKGEFVCEIGGIEYNASIDFETSSNRYRIRSTGLSGIEINMESNANVRAGNLLSYLNNEQAFRIITKGTELYSNGVFFKPRFPLWGRTKSNSIEFSNLFIADDILLTIESEKGDKMIPGANTWQKGSLFEYIDTRSKPTLFEKMVFNPDILICCDIGSEVADFLAVDRSAKRVCMIHAKSPSEDFKLSASDFQDVCSQAAKNLDFLLPLNDYKFPQDLSKPWKLTIAKKQLVLPRLREPKVGGDLKKSFLEVREMVNDPSSSKEVWIVMNKGLSAGAFEIERKKDKPKPSTIQLLYLMQSTWSAVSSMGAALKVIVRP